MPKFESFAPKVENLESDVETSLEKRKSVIEKLTNKFPKLRSLILAFITTTVALSAPELAQANEPVQGTKIEQKASRTEEGTVETALKKIDDQQFKDIVEKIKTEMALFNSDIPTNSLYGENWEYTTVNNGVTQKENKIGSLPESAQNVFINSEHMLGQCTKDGVSDGKRIANTMDSTKSLFYILPTEKGTIIEGGKIELEGIGRTRSEALQNALENSVSFLGVDVASATELNDKIEDGKKASFETTLTKTIKTGSRHFVKEYKIIKVEQGKGKIIGGDGQEYHVTVEITGGQFIPEK